MNVVTPEAGRKIFPIRIVFALPLVLMLGCNRETAPASTAEAADVQHAGQAFGGTVDNPGAPAVHVDDTVITQGDVAKAVNHMLNMWGEQVPPEEVERLRGQLTRGIVDQLVQRQLLLNAGKAAGIEVTPDEIQAILKDIEASLPEGLSLQDALAQQGLTSSDLQEGIEKDLALNKVIDQRMATLPQISDAEIQAFYLENPDQFHVPQTAQARHILVAFGDEDNEDRREALRVRAERIRSSIINGADFAELAAQHSDCPSKQGGGDLGRFPRGQMVPAFEEAVFTRDLEVIGPLVETRFGYHIIQVLAREEEGLLALDDVREQLGENLQNERRQEAVMAYLQELRATADIRYVDTALKPDAPAQP